MKLHHGLSDPVELLASVTFLAHFTSKRTAPIRSRITVYWLPNPTKIVVTLGRFYHRRLVESLSQGGSSTV